MLSFFAIVAGLLAFGLRILGLRALRVDFHGDARLYPGLVAAVLTECGMTKKDS
jgi:hypothetical protein